MPFLGLVFEKKLKEAEQDAAYLRNELAVQKEKSESEIQTLNQTISELKEKSESEIQALNQTITELNEKLLPEHNTIEVLEAKILALKEQETAKTEKLNKLSEKLKKINNDITEKKKELIELDDEVLYQSVNLFEPKYNFASSEEYKDRLEQIRNRQKEMVKDKTAVSYFKDWTVNGSLSEGRKMTNDNIKMILRCFNTDCDNAISKVKYNNVDSTQSRIQKSFDTLNKLNEINKVSLSKDYLNLKFAELWLAVEYAFKKQDEEEEQKQIRQELREQAKLQKELEEARKNIVKEQQHYSNALSLLTSQMGSDLSEEQKNNLLEKKQEVEEQLQKLQKSLENVDYRAANQ